MRSPPHRAPPPTWHKTLSMGQHVAAAARRADPRFDPKLLVPRIATECARAWLTAMAAAQKATAAQKSAATTAQRMLLLLPLP
jgi:truncated hemoglobin YjbI